MEPTTSPSEDELRAEAGASATPVKALPAARPGEKPAAPAAGEDGDEGEGDELELELDDDEDEDLVVFTAQEAAGALSTIYSFVKPLLGSYKKLLVFVSLGI